MGIDADVHQYAIVRHEDTVHEHIHIILNRVSVAGALWLGQWEMRRAMVATTKLELEFGLTQTTAFDPKAPAKRKNPKSGAIGVMRRTGNIPATMTLQDRIDAARHQSKTFAAFIKNLADLDVRLVPAGKTGQVPGVLFETGGVIVKGSSLGSDFAWKSIAEAVHYDQNADAPLIAKLRALGFAASSVVTAVTEEKTPEIEPRAVQITRQMTGQIAKEITKEITKEIAEQITDLRNKPKVEIKIEQKVGLKIKLPRRPVCTVQVDRASENAHRMMKRRLLEQHYQAAVSTQLSYLLAGVGLHRLPKSLFLTLKPQGQITDYGQRITSGQGNPVEITAMVELIRIKGWRKVRLTGSDDFIEKCALALMRAGKARTDLKSNTLHGHDAIERALAAFEVEQAEIKKTKRTKVKAESK